LLGDLLMQVFQSFLGIYAAGRLILTICVLALPLSTLFFLRRVNPGNDWLALWALVVAYNPNFLMGFISFELSVAVCLLVVGVWHDYLQTPRPRKILVLLFMATVLYFTHIGGFAVAGLAITVYTVGMYGLDQRLLKAWFIFLPGALLFLNQKLHGWSGRQLDYS